MSFKQLYEAVQADDKDVISTKWLRKKAIEFSSITLIKEQWSGVVDGTWLRGFYIEGPLGPPVPLQDHQSLIVLARAMCTGAQGEYWRRFVLTKELMHVFDTEEEKTDNADAFEKQINRLKDPSSEITPQYRAEQKAVWRALAVLCTERKRREYKSLLMADKISEDVVAASLRIPVPQVRNMMRDDFEINVAHSMD